MLVTLFEIPRNPQAWDRWAFQHRDSHDRIRKAIEVAGGPSLADYQIYPINLNRSGDFLQANSQMHIEMCRVLGIQSEDLQDVNLRDENQLTSWIWLHFLDHQNAETVLKI